MKKYPHPGRPNRTEPKSKLVWIGQHSRDEIEFIEQQLTPAERYAALMAAALAKETELD